MADRTVFWSRMGVKGKVLAVFLALSMLSLALIGLTAYVMMGDMGSYVLGQSVSLGERAVDDSTSALEGSARENLLNLARYQAETSDIIFARVESEMNTMDYFARRVAGDPTSIRSVSTYSQEQTPLDIYAAPVYLLAPGTSISAVREEFDALSHLEDIFIPVYASDDYLTQIYIGTDSGMAWLYPWTSGIDPSFDPRLRSWFAAAKETGTLGWSEPYIDTAGHGLTVTCYQPVPLPEKGWFWVIGADVTVETINQRIINTQVGEQGYAILVDAKGNIISSPGLTAGETQWSESFRTENLLSSGYSGLRAVGEEMAAGKSGITRLSFEGDEIYLAYAPIRSTGWSVGVFMPVAEIIAPAVATGEKIIAATGDTSAHINRQLDTVKTVLAGMVIAVFLGVIILSVVFARILTAPVEVLRKGSEAIGEGQLDYRVDVRTGDEFEELAGSFNRMAQDLKDYMEELRLTTAEKERIARELEIAKGIQESFLPECVPEIPGIEIAACSIPAMEVGGDFYDFISLSDNRWGIAIADVSGKGVPAALFMALSRTLVRASTTRIPSPAEAIREANSLICEDSKTSMFVTLFYAILDAELGRITYVNAGHNPPLLFKTDTAEITLLKAEGIALGVIDEIELDAVEVALKSGDILVFFTDGVTEAVNERYEEFGLDRLEHVVEGHLSLPVQEIMRRILDEITAFAGSQPQADDITLIVLRAK